MDLRDGWVLDELHKVLSLGKRQHAADGLCNGHNRMRLLRRNLELLEARIELTLCDQPKNLRQGYIGICMQTNHTTHV